MTEYCRFAVASCCRYPLAVKLGTITPHGADVYSYAPEEDSMVKASSNPTEELSYLNKKLLERANETRL